jgi:glycerol uptake facilitator-like aquaporin
MNFGHVPGFIAAQLLGAAAAAGVCAVLFSPSAAHAVRELR